jgi:vitamin B12/bleomycin/antimicrobial peptide transport system ATP-binding/permease protein
MDDIASVHDEEGEKRRLGLHLEKVLVMVREIFGATTKLT